VAWAPDQVVDHAVRSADPAEAPLPRGSLAEYAAATPLEALRRLDSTRYGLTEREAQARLSRLGENEMAAGPVPGRAAAVLAAARSPFAVVLIFLAAVSAATGDIGGAALISVMAVISCALRVRQENRSDRAAAALRAVVATTTTVLRRAADGCRGVARELPVDQLVPGDVVQLQPGEMVPADLRLLRSDDLEVSQAVFTGESLPVRKRAAMVVTSGIPSADPGPALFDSPLVCYMGTDVVAGSGTAVVVATGASTYLGTVRRSMPRRRAETAFDRGTRGVSWLLVSFMIACVPLVLTVSRCLAGSARPRTASGTLWLARLRKCKNFCPQSVMAGQRRGAGQRGGRRWNAARPGPRAPRGRRVA